MDKAVSILQAASGLVFSSFTLIHLGGHFLSPINFTLSDTALFATREFYQAPATETLLLASLCIHMSASATRFILRKNKTSVSSFLNWHRMTGMITGIFILPHLIGTRLSPFLCMHSF
jgi:predicted NAD/FAD-binding protein